jgi:hypothetical protein
VKCWNTTEQGELPAVKRGCPSSWEVSELASYSPVWKHVSPEVMHRPQSRSKTYTLMVVTSDMALNEEAEHNMRQDALENPDIYEAAAATPEDDPEE